jgi:hypothetical protein
VCGNGVCEQPWNTVGESCGNCPVRSVSLTFTHPNLSDVSLFEVHNEMVQTQGAFVRSGVCREPTLMRPPYGEISPAVQDGLSRHPVEPGHPRLGACSVRS